MKLDTPETVLLAAVGISPATLTEAVWALAHEAEPLIPARVVVVTTALGRGMIRRQLFQASGRFGGKTAWQALRDALEMEGIDIAGRLRFGETPDDIRVITTINGASGCSRELEDIRTPADNEATADFLLEQVRSFVENPDTRLIASIAGGRKTMGALLYACMTLAGRESDQITHVLVSEPFETIVDFLFPAQPGGKVKNRTGKYHDPADARIELARVPFVPLRNLFTRDFGQPAGTFSRLVGICRANVRLSVGEHLRLELETGRPECRVNARLLKLSPREYLVLLFFAQRARQGSTVLSAYDEAVSELDDFRNQLRKQAPASNWGDWRHELEKEIDQRDLTRLLSDLRTNAKRSGGDAAFLAACLPERGRCGLDLPPANITILDS